MLSTFESYRDVLSESRRHGRIVTSAWIIVGALFVGLVVFA